MVRPDAAPDFLLYYEVMRPTFRVARRITTAAAGFGAVASLLLPGLTSIVPSANAAPLRAAPGSTIGAEHQRVTLVHGSAGWASSGRLA